MKIKSVSLIISTYNWPEALNQSLNSVLRQTVLPTELIIADDGSKQQTKELIQEFTKRAPFPVFHEWHEDKGFRKTIILNGAILRSSSEYVIQIDGDIIVNSHFIEDHLSFAEEGCFIRGTRALLSPQITQHLLGGGKLSFITKLMLVFTQPANALRFPLLASYVVRKEYSGQRVKGCNMSFWRNDLISINGYDNTLQGWGHEDEELSCRLVNLGIQKKILRCSAIAYHLFHKWLSRDKEVHHVQCLNEVREKHLIRAANGLKELDNCK